MDLLKYLPRTWTERIASLAAATTLLFAGCSAIAVFHAAGCSSSSLAAESALVNTWSYYQAKSIKEHLFRLRLDALEHVPSSPAAAEQRERYAAEGARYEGEKNRLMQKAAELTETRVSADARCALIGRALVFLQTASCCPPSPPSRRRSPTGTARSSAGQSVSVRSRSPVRDDFAPISKIKKAVCAGTMPCEIAFSYAVFFRLPYWLRITPASVKAIPPRMVRVISSARTIAAERTVTSGMRYR